MNTIKSKFSNLGIRSISALVLAIILVSTTLLGGWFFYGLCLLVSMIGLWEFYRLFDISKKPIGAMGYLAAIVYYVFVAFGKMNFFFPTMVIGFLFILMGYVVFFKQTDYTQTMAAGFGYVYVPVFVSYLYRLRLDEGGIYLISLVFITSWGTDLFAYFIGSRFGKHKLAPTLSPKKSVEGAVGGLLCVTVIGGIFGYFFGKNFPNFAHPIIACTAISFFASLISMGGDLVASAFKRAKGIKDYSNIIPGHGGILDRFDSVIVVAPVIFYLTNFFKL